MLRGMFGVEEVGVFGGGGWRRRGWRGESWVCLCVCFAFLYGGICSEAWDSCCFFCSYDPFIKHGI